MAKKYEEPFIDITMLQYGDCLSADASYETIVDIDDSIWGLGGE